MTYVDTFKLIAGGVVWLQAILGGLGPLVLKDRVSPVAMSVLNMFAGGVFLAGSTMHLLPDAQENVALSTLGCISEGKCLQLPYFFYAVGFLVVMILEVFAHAIQRQFGIDGTTKSAASEHTPLILNTQTERAAQVKPGKDDLQLDKLGKNHHHVKAINGQTHHVLTLEQKDATYGLNRIRDTVNGISMDVEPCTDMEVTHAHVHGIMDVNPALAFVVFAALSFHSVMEGMGIGASNGAASGILIAIMAHKSLAAFALALELIHHQVPRERLVATIAIFSLMSPLGIFIGWLFVDATKETAASGICSAMAGGTFLFVAVMETIPQELQNQKCLGSKCAALLTGFFAMGLLSIWT